MELNMDEYSRSKKASSDLFLSKKGPGLSLRDASNNNNRDQTTTHVCSRIGCGSRMTSSITSSPIRSISKAKSVAKQPSQLSTNGKRVVAVGSSSKQQPSSSSSSSTRKSVLDSPKKPTSSQPDKVVESQNLQDRSSRPLLSTTPKSTQSRLKPLQGRVAGPQFVYREVNNSSSSSSTPQSGNSKKAIALSKFNDRPSTSAASGTGTKNGASTSRSIFRKCNSTSADPGPSSSSSSQWSHSGRMEVGKKRNSEAESSFSAKGKRMSSGGASTISDDKKANASNRGGSGSGISISDSRRQRTNLSSLGRDSNDNRSGALVRTNRSIAARTNRSNELENNRHRLVRRTESSSILGRRLPVPDNDNDMSFTGSESDLVYQSSAASSSGLTATIESLLGGDRSTSAPLETGFGGRSSTNRENLRLYNLDGITEMLLALERIEQNEELSYEQLLALESNLFLSGGGGLSFHDQHRDMRLDIDNMSYEELLALEEKIGIVSTALTEEDLERCIVKGIFQGCCSSIPDEAVERPEGMIGEADDLKCCICQEEYVDGDKVGRLGCEHRYHVECISQWLRLKNWCPICKVEVLQHSESLTAAAGPPSLPPASSVPSSSSSQLL